MTKSINDKEIEPLHGCTRGVNRGHSSVVLCDRLRSSQPMHIPPPADAYRPRGKEASTAVSWPIYFVSLPLAPCSSAPCHAATNCDKLSDSQQGQMGLDHREKGSIMRPTRPGRHGTRACLVLRLHSQKLFARNLVHLLAFRLCTNWCYSHEAAEHEARRC